MANTVVTIRELRTDSDKCALKTKEGVRSISGILLLTGQISRTLDTAPIRGVMVKVFESILVVSCLANCKYCQLKAGT